MLLLGYRTILHESHTMTSLFFCAADGTTVILRSSHEVMPYIHDFLCVVVPQDQALYLHHTEPAIPRLIYTTLCWLAALHIPQSLLFSRILQSTIYQHAAQNESSLGAISSHLKDYRRPNQKTPMRSTQNESSHGCHWGASTRTSHPPSIDPRHVKEEENHYPREKSSDKESQLNKFGVTYQRRIMPSQQYNFGVKIILPKFDGKMDPDEFVD